MTEGTDRRRRELLGVHVLGQLSGEEERELADLLERDPAARGEEAELRGVAALLAAADPALVGGPGADLRDAQPSADLEDRVVAAAMGERRGRRGGRRWGTAGAGLVAVAAAIGAIALVVQPDPPVVPGTLGATEQIAFDVREEGVEVTAAAVAHTWGTELEMEIVGFQTGEVYTVTLESEAGETVVAGSMIGDAELPIVCSLNGALMREDTDAVVVTDGSGAEILRSTLADVPA